MLFKETLHGAIEIEAVFLILESVTFVFFHHVFHRHSALAQCSHYLVALGLINAGVMRTLRHKERHTDAVGVEGGRSGFEALAVGFGIAHLLIHHFQHRFPIRRDSAEEGEQIGNADVIHGAGILFRRECHAGKGGVTAITAAVDGYALGVGNALADEPVHAVGNVVLHAQPLG